MEHPPAETVYRGDLGKLLAKVEADRGIDLTQYRRNYVERRVASRLRTLNLHTYRQYARYIDDHVDEYEKLLDVLTINVTEFFRDEPVYTYFRSTIVPEILDRKERGRHRMLRVWSAGCATGEEPYSLAMMFLSALERRKTHFMLTVFGTDLDPEALATARRGEYEIAKIKHVSAVDRSRFLIVGPERFQVSPEVASHVRFRQLNLFTDRPLSIVDVIFCRNVFIYFNRDQQARVLEAFHSALARGGYLVLGRSEKLAPAVSELFETVSGRDRVYRKI